MSSDAIQTAAVVGTTAWGTTLAVLLARNGVRVTLLARDAAEAAQLQTERANSRRLPDLPFPPGLEASADTERLAGAQLVCFAVPSQTMVANARAVAGAVAGDAIVLSGSKGIEHATGRRMTEVLAGELPGRPTAALSGPNLSPRGGPGAARDDRHRLAGRADRGAARCVPRPHAARLHEPRRGGRPSSGGRSRTSSPSPPGSSMGSATATTRRARSSRAASPRYRGSAWP